MADTRPITRLTIKDTETGAETETDVKTCARGVTCDEGKTVQDHISDFVAHKKDVNRHVLVQVGGDEPATGPALWLDEDSLLHYKDKSGIKKDLYPATKAALVEGLSALLTGVKKSAQSDLSSHTSDKNNPHGVTAEQAGADPKGAAAAVQGNLDTHTGNKNNPHNVTCDQIGAIKSSMLGKPNGPAKLDADGKLIKDQLPPVGGSRITITFEAAFQGATWTLTGGGENYSGVVDSTLKAVVPVMGVNTLYTVSAAVGGTTYTAEITTLDYFTALSVALTQFQATIIVTVDSGSTVTAACGTTLTKTSTGTAIFTVGKAGTWTITATKDGNTATGTVEITASGQSKNLTLDYAAVFGVCWDTSNSSTALTRLTKTSDPYGFVTKDVTTEPVPAVGTGSGSSPFDRFAPWNGMKQCKMDATGKVLSWIGDANWSSISTNFRMVYIPEFYVAYKSSGTKKYFYISEKLKAGFSKHPGSGKFVGRYILSGNNSSEPGYYPKVNITRSAARDKTKNIGSSKWHLYDFATYCAIIWLYLIEFANWDCQSKIGRGFVSGSSSTPSGNTDNMAYHTGCAGSGDTAIQYRWIENLWGNASQWVDGFNANGTTAYYCLDPSKYADDTTTGYTQIGTLSASGWIKDLTVTDNGLLIPKTVGGSETTFIPDYAGSSSGWHVLFVGGYWSSGSYAGLLYFDANVSSSVSDSYISARLLCEA